jgi:hypothetical protein
MSLVLQSSGGGSVTIQEPTTASNLTATLPAATGTVMVSGNMPAFSAYRNGTTFTAITSGVFTKVTFDVEVFDTNNNFASSTFTPTVAGYYQINAQAYIQGVTVTRSLGVIYKNGSAYQNGNEYQTNTNLTASRVTASSLVYCNGTTDYIEFYVYAAGTSLSTSPSNGLDVWFSGSMVRGA